MARGKGRGRHEIGKGRGSQIGNGINVHTREQSIIATSQSIPNPKPSEAPKVGANLSTLYPNGKM